MTKVNFTDHMSIWEQIKYYKKAVFPILIIFSCIICITLFVSTRDLNVDKSCRALFNPENSPQTFNEYSHCIVYPNAYNITNNYDVSILWR